MKTKMLSIISVILPAFLFAVLALPVVAQVPTATPTPTITVTPTPTIKCSALPANKNTVNLTYDVASDGAYRVWTRIQGVGTGWLQVDSNCAVKVGGDINWNWYDHEKGDASKKITYNLTKGSHKIKYLVDEGNFNVDKVILTDDLNCAPVDKGADCDGSTNPGVTQAPPLGCLGGCPTMTPTPTYDPNAPITIGAPTLPGGGGGTPCGTTGGGGLIGLIMEFIMKLLELLFGSAICTTPGTPAPAPTTSPSTPTATPSASLTPTTTGMITPTVTGTIMPTLTVTPTVTPTVTQTP